MRNRIKMKNTRKMRKRRRMLEEEEEKKNNNDGENDCDNSFRNGDLFRICCCC